MDGYSWLKPLLFLLPPEKAHSCTLSALHAAPSCFFKKKTAKPVQALGLNFPHFVGLAAGLDKNGEHLDALAKLGFSHIEIGTVTPKPQAGNIKPRLFRLPTESALINRMGFNNQGVDALLSNLERTHYQGILGINIGKNKNTALSEAVHDYVYCLNKVCSKASYITINISSPNTPDLRLLQQVDYLKILLSQLKQTQMQLAEKHGKKVPLVVKLSPDESEETLKKMAGVIVSQGIEGIIATNTTCSRDKVAHLKIANEEGGLSGKPLFEKATACLRILKQEVGESLTLIGVGGIDSAEAALEKKKAGATLVQLYTGLIYKGPALLDAILQAE